MSIDVGLLLLRVFIGAFMLGHGLQKLFGWFNGGGLQGTHGMITKQRLRPVSIWKWMVILAEVGGGLFFALGLLSPLAAVAIVAAMIMAMALVTWPKFWGSKGGIEYNLLFVVPAVVIAITGPGAYSLDAAFGIALPTLFTFVIGLALALVVIAIALATRQPVPAQTLTDTTRVDDRTPVGTTRR